MIGKIPTVLKIKIQINRVRSLLVPAFQSAIPFHIISRIISNPMITTHHSVKKLGGSWLAIAVVWGSIVYDYEIKRTDYETNILPAPLFSIFQSFNNKGSTSSSTAFSLIPSCTAIAFTPIGLSAFSSISKYFA
jgi:hypothetical protein